MEKTMKKIKGKIIDGAIIGNPLMVKLENGDILKTSRLVKVHGSISGTPLYETKNTIYIIEK